MLGEVRKEKYGTKTIEIFLPYSLNGVYVLSKKSEKIEELVKDIENLFPLKKPLNKFFLDLLQDKEMLDSLVLSGQEQSFEDMYSDDNFNLFKETLHELKEVYEYAPTHMNELGYSNRFIKDLHHALFGKNISFYPGEFRKVQSFVGDAIENASYIPPDIQTMQDNMDEMELFMHRDDLSVYVKASLLYYQIMANLPFLIGNQEIARMASQLYMIEFDGLNHYIPLSKHLVKVEDERIKAMNLGDINIFVIAFLEALKNSLIDANKMISSYNNLKKRQQKVIENSNHTIYQKRRLMEVLHQSHKTIYLNSEPLEERFGVLSKTIIKRYRLLMELGVLKCKTTFFSKLYYNQKMKNIFKWK